MSVPDSDCPECGEPPTDASIVEQRLSSVGYLHEDTRLQCSNCDSSWVVGKPRGEPETGIWVCDSCGGDYIPHFLNLALQEGELQVRPKCRDCYYVPDERIRLDLKQNGDNLRAFIGHHAVTGDTTNATEDAI